MRDVYFRGEVILKDVPEDVTPEQVRERLSQSMPELQNATYAMLEGGAIEFRLESGEKG